MGKVNKEGEERERKRRMGDREREGEKKKKKENKNKKKQKKNLRHPFTAQDLLVSKWCNARPLQFFSDEKNKIRRTEAE